MSGSHALHVRTSTYVQLVWEGTGAGGKVKMNAVENCKDHEFTKVPSEGCHRLIERTGNERVESEDKWLRRPEKTYDETDGFG